MDPNRRKDYKKAPSIEDARRRRTETTTQLRKEKKEEHLEKRRGKGSDVIVGQDNNNNVSKTPLNSEALLSQLQEHRANIISNDPIVQVKATQGFRRLLSIGMTYFYVCNICRFI